MAKKKRLACPKSDGKDRPIHHDFNFPTNQLEIMETLRAFTATGNWQNFLLEYITTLTYSGKQGDRKLGNMTIVDLIYELFSQMTACNKNKAGGFDDYDKQRQCFPFMFPLFVLWILRKEDGDFPEIDWEIFEEWTQEFLDISENEE